MLCLSDNIDLIKRQNEELKVENKLLTSRNSELENNLVELLESVALLSEEKETEMSSIDVDKTDLYELLAQIGEDIMDIKNDIITLKGGENNG